MPTCPHSQTCSVCDPCSQTLDIHAYSQAKKKKKKEQNQNSKKQNPPSPPPNAPGDTTTDHLTNTYRQSQDTNPTRRANRKLYSCICHAARSRTWTPRSIHVHASRCAGLLARKPGNSTFPPNSIAVPPVTISRDETDLSLLEHSRPRGPKTGPCWAGFL